MGMKSAILGAVAGTVALAAAASAAEDPIEARQAIMKNVGGAAQAGGAMARGEAEFDAERGRLVFRTMNAAIIGFVELFPEGSESGGETDAAPAIWEDMEGFLEKAAVFRQASAEAIEAAPANLDSFRQTFASVTQGCGGCHETYRLDD